MASAHIQALLQPPSIATSHKKTLDFINATYPTLDALELDESFDTHLEQERQQTEELRSKLLSSQQYLDNVLSQTRETAQNHLHTAQELSLLRHSLADELAFLSEDLVSTISTPNGQSTLLEDIETMHRSLKELESVKGYVQVIQHAVKLSEAATSQASQSSSPLSAVSQYEELKNFVVKVAESCENVEDASGPQTLHLITFLHSIKDRAWHDIKAGFVSTLVAAAEKLQWPSAVDYPSASPQDRKTFEAAFLDLFKLQSEAKRLQVAEVISPSEKDGLYSIQALVQPIALRFKYHFEGSRQTNRLDKPEWYFTHVLNAAHEHRAFMDSVVQRLVSGSGYPSINAWREFTRLLFPLLSRKLRKTVPALIPHPSVLAHTIYQALSFDSAIKDEGFEIAGTSVAVSKDTDHSKQKWEGISEIILGQKEWFEAWMEGERKFAMDQYVDIISASDAWLIADENDNEEDDGVHVAIDIRPTVSARRVKALVEQVTDRYSPLPQFGHRTRFLITVQLPLLESYHARISSSLDAFETLSSSFMRAVPGALSSDVTGRANDPKRLTSGVEGVQRLCKALISATYLAAAMDAWGEDLFFLELWAEINRKASLRTRAEASASLPDPKNSSEEDVPEGTIFEELVTQYAKLGERAEELIVQSVCGEVEQHFKAHYSGTSSQHSSAETTTDDITVSATLLGPIATLSGHLTFLQSTLPQKTVGNIYRRIASRLALHIMQRQVIYRGRTKLTAQQGKVILAEFELWAETCRLALARIPAMRSEAPWRSLLEAGRIVAADGERWRGIVQSTFGMNQDQEWEKNMLELVGFAELSREEVGQIIRTRADFDQ
ncbi:RINT-1 family protein [Cristinia sonorae]|uniref:RINT-1 family protein n=1 Tax=Cristinia sonorae TaxID=1940300 RepID=A0A8K0XPM4_9AGAR|nr:RINT-1 family protein [Cristinia sonorae]